MKTKSYQRGIRESLTKTSNNETQLRVPKGKGPEVKEPKFK